MIVVDIDELTPCLVDTVTRDILETECIAIKRTSFLKKYYESLEHTPEPEMIAHPLEIDYNGLIQYARQKGVQPCDLSESEKEQFVIHSVQSAMV